MITKDIQHGIRKGWELLNVRSFDQFYDFLQGNVYLELLYLEKTHMKRKNLRETISDTILLHWFISNKKHLPEIINEYIIPSGGLPMKIYDPPKYKPKPPPESEPGPVITVPRIVITSDDWNG